MTRTVRRWVGYCLVTTFKDGKVIACPWNARDDKALYLNPGGAARNASDHAAQEHVEAREVKVVRTYTLSKEEVVEP